MIRGARIALLLALLIASQITLAVGEESKLVPHPPKGRGEQCVAATDFMRRNHMSLMKHQRDETVREGVRGKAFSLTGCIDCHAVNGADAKPVSYADSRHFCRSCHDYAAVSIDCFQCHASRPGSERPHAAQGVGSTALAAVAAYFQGAANDRK
ncbi:hypothetical protein JDN40_09045 [Rhodomicrobium vannielii ATCC 17100]|uniref:hypothetical protein n=1 Tax=Rhodomicrobium vannielii TaxID=1069 RepID=UPI00191ACF27|nr:hypothetical protein [Rhodomicrobium vannielii]MBJ7534248.1 hypothetical protein [Rhodomicrobium vannielii ATCC 17100]